MSTTGVYHGSCHCGSIKYQIRLTFPPSLTDKDPAAKTIRIYKCNCSTCQKMGYFHLRPINASDDFILTSPSTIEELGDYRCFDRKVGWYFCKTCGVRTFGLGGEWEQVELDVEKWAGKEDGEGQAQKVWKTKPMDIKKVVDGKEVTKSAHYVSVNAVTLEAGQEGADLRKWHEQGWIFYVDSKNHKEAMRFGEPHEGGMY
ncbi:uncharacterized protein BDR25DRAFT_11134 [Lindgomyces ingoldianus]|uniref:Uncharacterized protein n=1 Tax=Lindgomyces ingoldianus TaxID=673940 RepID=A0ACB6R080_9PLEO|nr:uncharacterized protein BDR25DRAFT_11134 [Lindgomyces ingoldianus]KAF2472714.1 hypothetical protein BDR25DRAFT_11134 [Lindgomyces ingoldianus]